MASISRRYRIVASRPNGETINEFKWPWIFISLFYLIISAVFGLFGASAGALAVQAILLIFFGGACAIREWRLNLRMTLSAAFVAIYAYVYGVRALYIYAYSDFDIFARPFSIFPTWLQMNQALAMISASIAAFSLGGIFLEERTVAVNRAAIVGWKRGLKARPSLSGGQQLLMIGLQALLVFSLMPVAFRDYKFTLTDQYATAYIYLLPTMMHGVNLFVVTILLLSLAVDQSLSRMLTVVTAAIAVLLMVFNAYLLANLSTFRGFWMAGFLLIAVATIYVLRGRVHILFLLLLFAIYPFFKQLGMDRSLSSLETIEMMIEDPVKAYTKQGIEDAYGVATDLNMFDTFVASTMWQHNRHPYVLTVLYTFVHWIPRQWWPAKPEGGSMADTAYTNDAPYSPGIVGFFYDDGGPAYMLLMMVLLGAFVRYLDWRVALVRDQLLQACVYACLFFGVVVLTRSFLYQAVYGVLAFLGPLFITYKLLWGKRGLRLQAPIIPGLPKV